MVSEHSGTSATAAGERRVDEWRPHPTMKEYYESEEQRRRSLTKGFNETAPHYDRINQIISLGSDRWYRRRSLVDHGLKPGMLMLDVGCGTGMTSAAARSIVGDDGRVVGVDPSAGMISVAKDNQRVDEALIGTAEALPVDGDHFDMVTMTFALRHVSSLVRAFSEFHRVLKPGGRVLVLEMTTPTSGWRYHALKFYMKRIVPLVASLRTGGRTARWLYQYCWDSHDRCVRPDTIIGALREAGFSNVTRRVQLGIFSEYSAQKD